MRTGCAFSVGWFASHGAARPGRARVSAVSFPIDTQYSSMRAASRRLMTVCSTGASPIRTRGSADDVRGMREALKQAHKAYAAGEVPIGAVVMNPDGDIVGTGRNRVEELRDVTAHAEIQALRSATSAGSPARTGRGLEGSSMGSLPAEAPVWQPSWRLNGHVLYCTVEPCAMCFSAMSLARIRRLVYAAPDLRLGACGTWIDLTSERHPYHTLDEIASGICEEEASELLRRFFRERRAQSSN